MVNRFGIIIVGVMVTVGMHAMEIGKNVGTEIEVPLNFAGPSIECLQKILAEASKQEFYLMNRYIEKQDILATNKKKKILTDIEEFLLYEECDQYQKSLVELIKYSRKLVLAMFEKNKK